MTMVQLISRTEFDDARFRNVSLVIAKVTHRCNLDCAYCYEHIGPGADMDIALFRQVISKVIKSTRRDFVRIVLHGGEPSLMSRQWLTEAVTFVETEARIYGKTAAVGMQSNILALNEDRLGLIKRLGISLGASMDGPGDLPNAMRPLAARAAKKYELARSIGVQIGILMTINNSNWNHFSRIMEWLAEEIGATSCKVNPVTPVGMGKNLPWLDAEQVFKAYKDILDYMIGTQGRVVEDNMMREIRRFFGLIDRHDENTLCNKRTCGAGSEVIGITPTGNILPCGRFSWNESNYFLGGISDNGDAAAAEGYFHSINEFQKLVPESWYDCDECPARKICSFGCQAFIVRSKQKANVDCLPTKMRYEYFKDKSEDLKSLISVIDGIDTFSGRRDVRQGN